MCQNQSRYIIQCHYQTTSPYLSYYRFQVQRVSDNKTYALKEMDVRAMNQAEREDAANEIRLLASVQVRCGCGIIFYECTRYYKTYTVHVI